MSLFCCPKCSQGIDLSRTTCTHCHFAYTVTDGVPIFGEDLYWGKIPEQGLLDIIDHIRKEGFQAFTKEMQKKLDFTYDEDRADWRFFIPLSSDATVLDIGSGLGRITIPLARAYAHVVSCDLSLSRMKFLKERAKAEGLSNVDVFVGDVYSLPLKEKSFDLIVMNGVLEWVGLTKKYRDPREAQIKNLEICKKLLKPGGYIYVGIENRAALVYMKAKDHGGLRFTSYMPRFVANWYSQVRGKGEYRTYTYTKRGYEKLVREAGFTQKPQFYLPYPGYNLPRIVIPYEHTAGLQYLIKTFKYSNNWLKNVLFSIVSMKLFIVIYKQLFFSYGIVIQNDTKN